MTTVSPTPTPTPTASTPTPTAAPVPATVPVAPGPAPQSAMRLREIVFGAAIAAAVRAAARLGVADALGDSPATAAELAAAVGAEPQPLHRLLRALSCYGVFAQTEDGRFLHTDMSRMLREDDPHSLRYISLWCTEPWTWQAWPRLDDAVRSGGSVFQELYGKGFFDYLHQDAHESAHVFNQAMTTSSTQSALDVAELLDLTAVRVVADIGGGQGHVLASLLEKHPDVRGVLLDLPGVAAKADPRLREGGPLAGRTRIVPGDCREAIPVEADMYIIKNILEWDDDSTCRTLRNVIAAARPGARVVVIENLVDDTPSMKFTTAMDLMLLLNVGGAKHTRDSLVSRMSQAGLELREIRPVNAYLHAFECTVPG
ncbi:methyltransferase [Streptomyces sp. CB00455]|uniref:methyltransferase n=1 Tax=Streptomyces sp. CB00455 TaxID=1703927 RepID=UPI00093C6715|nr:methyltransferase [Streptomyces sp. CB00455]OKK17593.1 methyltransferase [Streptomyces sp. CB00455]